MLEYCSIYIKVPPWYYHMHPMTHLLYIRTLNLLGKTYEAHWHTLTFISVTYNNLANTISCKSLPSTSIQIIWKNNIFQCMRPYLGRSYQYWRTPYDDRHDPKNPNWPYQAHTTGITVTTTDSRGNHDNWSADNNNYDGMVNRDFHNGQICTNDYTQPICHASQGTLVKNTASAAK